MKRLAVLGLFPHLLLACGGNADSANLMQPGVIGDTQSSGAGTSSTQMSSGSGGSESSTTTGTTTTGSTATGSAGSGSGGASGQTGTIATAGNASGSAGGAAAGGQAGEGTAGAIAVAGRGGAAGGPTVITAGSGSGDTPYCEQTAAGSIDATAGTFADHCDDNGDLVQYRCEVRYELDPNCSLTGAPTPAAGAPLADIAAPFCNNVSYPTGNVIEQVSQCGGLCQDVACPNLCPAYDETLVYRSIDRGTGQAVFAFDRVGHDLSCELIFDRADDGYDCVADPQASSEIIVPSLGLSSPYCVEGNIGNIGVNDPSHPDGQECSYRCDVVAR